MKKILLPLIAIVFFSSVLHSQNLSPFWESISEKQIGVSGERVIVPQKYKTFHLPGSDLKNALFNAPHEDNVSLQNSNTIIDLPLPDGSVKRFKVVESPCMAPELSARFPTIKTFNAVCIDMPSVFGKLDWTEFGFHGMLFTPEGNIFIDPYSRNNVDDYIVYYSADFSKDPLNRSLPECGAANKNTNTGSKSNIVNNNNVATTGIFAGATLRTYRLAIACTGEYAVAATGVGSPTTAQILSVVTTSANRVDGVYETEAAIKMVLVATETSILFGNAATDPFNGNNNANTLINESQTQIDNRIGNANYDIGHTFSTGGGGLAQLGAVCQTGSKASGITGSPSPVGDPYDIDFVAHEIGHEFGGNHSFNQCTGNATNNPGTEVEPLSGITIMGYAGVCATADNLALHSIAYFHTINYDEVMTYSNNGSGNTCPVKTTTGNNPPVVTGSATYTIPKSTPFTLTGSATDPNGDALTYSWEEIDNNNTAHAGGTAAPYFRNWVPTTSPSRTFPQMPFILNGTNTQKGEYLPAAAQTLKFRLVARDNKMGGGGVSYAASNVVVAATGPFAVTYPNVTGITWASASSQTVTWSVGSSDIAPVSCANVNILLSVDGGTTYTMVLANTPNDGTQLITVPSQATTKTLCRIRVEGAGNIFFDIGDKNFTITAATGPIASVSILQTTGTNPTCSGATNTFTATPTNGGSAPTYQWQVNGSNVGTNSTTYTTTTITNGQSVTCIMTSNLAGVVGSPATSNSITMNIGTAAPSITISGPSSICGTGASATYTAAITNGGSSPTYQWQVSGVNAGTNSSTFTTSSLTNGQTVTCTLTSNATCLSTNTATSNTITVTVVVTGTLPFVEKFEIATFPPTGWSINNPDGGAAAWGTTGAKAWVRRAAAGNTGSSLGSAAINYFEYNDTTQIDELITKPISLSGATNPSMTFKRAYHYYPAVPWLDELRVFVSTDCGATYGSALYYKKGVQLATDGWDTLTFTPTVASNWDIDTVDLSAYVGQNIKVKFQGSCRYGNNLYLDDINISSAAAPVAGVTIVSNDADNIICAGTSVTFTATPTNGGTTPSYQWKIGGISVGTNSPTYTTTTLTNGQIVTCVMTSNLSGVTGSPATSNAITMTVNANVTPAVSVAANPSGAICAGTSVTFTATPSNGGSTPSYQWKVNGTNAGTNSATFTSSTLTNGQVVTCVLTSNATCASPATATSTAITMTVNAKPVLTITNPSAVCSPGTIDITTAVTTAGSTGGGTLSYWTNAGATTALTSPNSIATSGTYYIKSTTSSGCIDIKPVTVTINAAPVLTITNPGPVCSPGTVNLTAAAVTTGSTGGGTLSYWSDAAATNSLGTPTAVGTSGTYYIKSTTGAGCTDIKPVTVTINSSVTPAVSISSSASGAICSGTSVIFTATASNGGSSPAYQWQVNGTNAGTNSSTFTSSSLTNGQVVTCILTSNATCASSTTATSSGITMTVNNTPPAASVSQNGLVLTSSASTGNQWYLNGNIIPGATSQTYTATQNGTYTVVVTVNGCSSSVSSPNNVSTVGITDAVSDVDFFNIYPNPNDGQFTVAFEIVKKDDYVLELRNELGQIVFKDVLSNYNGAYSRKVDITGYGKGIYFMVLTNKSKESIKKVIVY